jgi:hypothetical protein
MRDLDTRRKPRNSRRTKSVCNLHFQQEVKKLLGADKKIRLASGTFCASTKNIWIGWPTPVLLFTIKQCGNFVYGTSRLCQFSQGHNRNDVCEEETGSIQQGRIGVLPFDDSGAFIAGAEDSGKTTILRHLTWRNADDVACSSKFP